MTHQPISRSHKRLLAGSALALAGLGLAIAMIDRGNDAVQEARLLIEQLDFDAEVSDREYAVWKQMANADERVRLELARLLQERRYAPLLLDSTQLIGNTLVGLDYEGGMSRNLADELICKTLADNPGATADAAALYLIPALNAAALDSDYCAGVLIASLAADAPGTLVQRVELLSMVLGKLPAELAAPHAATILGLMESAGSSGMAVLVGTMQELDPAVFVAEFEKATAILMNKLAEATSAAVIADCFDAIDVLKYKRSPAQLTPLIDLALGRMLELRDPELTRALDLTLLDLKDSHPGISFGRRADYLMRGLKRFGENVELLDYSGVLRLDEQYAAAPGHELALATALLTEISMLRDDEYVGAIVPYCERFLELSAALPYELFADGVRLLGAQLDNAYFIFERWQCLLDPRFVDRLESNERAELTAAVIGALQRSGGSAEAPDPDRVTDLMEILGHLNTDLGAADIARIAATIAASASVTSDFRTFSKLLGSTLWSRIEFSPTLYTELLAVAPNTTSVDSGGLSTDLLRKFLEQLPEAERTEIMRSTLDYVFAQSDPAILAAQVDLLAALKTWIPGDAVAQLDPMLMNLLADLQDTSALPRVAKALVAFEPQYLMSRKRAYKSLMLPRLAASTRRSDIVNLLSAMRALAVVRVLDADDKAVMEAAAVRFLEQPAAGDRLDPPLQGTLAHFKLVLSPAAVQQLAAHYVMALGNENTFGPAGDYADSIETLALHGRPGELDALLDALRRKLDSPVDIASRERLLSDWLAVEAATNANLSAGARLRLYVEILQLPLNTDTSHALLLERAGTIAMMEFRDMRQVVGWSQNGDAFRPSQDASDEVEN